MNEISTETALTEQDVVEVLQTIYDPEIPVNIYDLGLIYDIEIRSEKSVYIKMTLTAPGCPVAGTFPGTIRYRVMSELELDDVDVELTFDPPYTIERMSEAARLELGFM